MTPPSIPPELLDRYLADETTIADSARVAAWLAAHPQASVLADALHSGAFAGTVTPDERSHVQHLVERKIGQELVSSERRSAPRVELPPRVTGLRRYVVAAIALVAVATAGWVRVAISIRRRVTRSAIAVCGNDDRRHLH